MAREASILTVNTVVHNSNYITNENDQRRLHPECVTSLTAQETEGNGNLPHYWWISLPRRREFSLTCNDIKANYSHTLQYSYIVIIMISSKNDHIYNVLR